MLDQLLKDVHQITKDENTYYKGKDLCKILGYRNHRAALKQHVSNQYKKRLCKLKGAPPNRSLENNHPDSVYVNESGLYELILSSKSTEAHEIKMYLFENVFPKMNVRENFSIY